MFCVWGTPRIFSNFNIPDGKLVIYGDLQNIPKCSLLSPVLLFPRGRGTAAGKCTAVTVTGSSRAGTLQQLLQICPKGGIGRQKNKVTSTERLDHFSPTHTTRMFQSSLGIGMSPGACLTAPSKSATGDLSIGQVIPSHFPLMLQFTTRQKRAQPKISDQCL